MDKKLKPALNTTKSDDASHALNRSSRNTNRTPTKEMLPSASFFQKLAKERGKKKIYFFFVHGTASSKDTWVKEKFVNHLCWILSMQDEISHKIDAEYNWEYVVDNSYNDLLPRFKGMAIPKDHVKLYGGVSKDVRRGIASRFKNHIVGKMNGLDKNEYYIVLVGHSHGGNVALQTAPLLSNTYGKVGLVTIATPSYNERSDSENPSNVKQHLLFHYHIYHGEDTFVRMLQGHEKYTESFSNNFKISFEINKKFKSYWNNAIDDIIMELVDKKKAEDVRKLIFKPFLGNAVLAHSLHNNTAFEKGIRELWEEELKPIENGSNDKITYLNLVIDKIKDKLVILFLAEIRGYVTTAMINGKGRAVVWRDTKPFEEDRY